MIHQVNQISDHFLRALNGKRWNEHHAATGACIFQFVGENFAALFQAALEAIAPAIGGFADHIIPRRWGFWVLLEQFIVGANVARE